MTHLETPAEPQTVHLEVRLGSEIDTDRLRAATRVALEAIPKARARRRPWRWSDRGYLWETGSGLDLDPVAVHSCGTADEIRDLRERAISTPIELDDSPPIRMVAINSPSGSSLLLVAHHAATDAVGALRLLRSIAAAYDGEAPEAEPLAALAASAGDAERAGRLASMASLARVLRHAATAPARIAADHPSSEPGYRIHASSFLVAALSRRRPDATVNDVLIAAMHLAIDRWNAEHSAPADRVGLMLPVNLRPAGALDGAVGNCWLAVVISTRPEDRRSPARALAAVVKQTRAAKRRADAASLHRVVGRSPAVPVWLKHLVPAIHPLTGHRLEDTAVLSNLGAVPPLRFAEAGTSTALLFSPPARMPKGLSVGCATHGEDLWLTYRYCPALFDRSAADRFASTLHRSLDAVCET